MDNAMYAQVIESSRDGIWVFDPDGRTLFTNARLAELLGHTVADMRDTHVHDFLDEEGRAQFARHLVELKEVGENAADVECVYRRKDGSPVDLMVSESTLRDEHGEVIGVRPPADPRRRAPGAAARAVPPATSCSTRRRPSPGSAAGSSTSATDTMTWSRQMYAILGAEPGRCDPERRRLPRADRGGRPGDGHRAVPRRGSRTWRIHLRRPAPAPRRPGGVGRGIGRVTYDADGRRTARHRRHHPGHHRHQGGRAPARSTPSSSTRSCR